MHTLLIETATYKAAKFACEHWHYSKSIPVPPLIRLGVWEDRSFVGVVLFSRGASPALLKPYGLNRDEGCELTRVALNTHITPVSKIIRICLSIIKKTNPGLKLVISYADPMFGHHGGIYQAGSWIFSGQTAKSKAYYKDGKRLHSRQVSSKGYNKQLGCMRKCFKPSECKEITLLPKLRYLMPLNKATRHRVELLAKPYPKRLKQAMAPTRGTAVVRHQPSRSKEYNA